MISCRKLLINTAKYMKKRRCHLDISIQFKKGALEICVLVLIHEKDRYGYELAQSVSEHIEVAEGALYPLLRRLVNEGHCTTYLQESSEGPPVNITN